MSLTTFSVHLTHTGVFTDGRPNTGAIFIPDLDTGLENQRRKVPCYVPYLGSIDIPLSSRSMLSLSDGYIFKFVQAGLLKVDITITLRNAEDLGGFGGTGVFLSPGILNIERVGDVIRLLVPAAESAGLVRGEPIVIVGLVGPAAVLNGDWRVATVTKGTSLVGFDATQFLVEAPSVGPNVAASIQAFGKVLLPEGKTVVILSGSGGAGGISPATVGYFGGDVFVAGAVDPVYTQFIPTQTGIVDPVSIFINDLDGQPYFKDQAGVDHALTAGGGGGSPPPTAVFRPGGPASGNIYNDFGTAITALNAISGNHWLLIDDSIISPAPINVPGTYDLTNIALYGSFSNTGAQASALVSEGVHFIGLNYVSTGLTLANDGSTAVVTSAGGATIVQDGGGIFTIGPAPFFDVPAGIQHTFVGKLFGNFGNGVNPVINCVDPSSVAFFVLADGSGLNNNALTGPGMGQVIFTSGAQFSNTMPGVGTYVLMGLSRANQTSYNPNTPSDWAPVPSDVAAALDQLAAGGGGGGVGQQNLFVFAPGGPDAGIVFGNWPALYALASTMRGPVTIMIAPTGGPVVIPPGGYSFQDGFTLLGTPAFGSGSPQLILSDGVQFNTAGQNIHSLDVEVQSLGTAPFEGNTGTYQATLSGDARIRCTGTAPAFSLHGNGPQRLILKDRSRLANSPVAVISVFNGPGPTSLEVYASENAVVEDNTIVFGAAGTFQGFQSDAAVISHTQLGSPITLTTAGTYEQDFSDADLLLGMLTLPHNLNMRGVMVTIFDDTGAQILPNGVTPVGLNSVEVDLSGFGVLPGTWQAVVRR